MEKEDVHAEQQHGEPHKQDGGEERLHGLQREFGGDGLVIIDTEDHPGESIGQRYHAEFAPVFLLVRVQRNGVRDIHFAQGALFDALVRRSGQDGMRGEGADDIAVTSVSLNKTEIALIKDRSETLTATVSPSDATDRKVTWSSSNTGIAIVDQNGKVTAISGGSATITAKAGDKQASCAVTVSVPATSVTLNSNELILVKGQSDRLVATIQPYDATDMIVWSSSNTSVASVDANGTVVAISNGNASISATAGSIQASCKVIVVDPDVSTNAIFYTTSDGNEYYPYHIEVCS